MNPEKRRQRLAQGFVSTSPQGADFLAAESLEQQQIIDEAVFLFQGALEMVAEFPQSVAICDAPKQARRILDVAEGGLVVGAKLRSAKEFLWALDLHFRLHGAARRARRDESDGPADWELGALAK